jgi:hypothetical protein
VEIFSVVALVLVLAVIWWYQFVQLMLLADADFPGKYDKILWVAAFVWIAPLAPLAFLLWKSAYLSLRAVERRRRDSDVPRH